MHGGGGFSGGGHHGGGFGGHHHGGGLGHHGSHHHHTGDSQGFVGIPSFRRRGSSGEAAGVAPLPVALGLLLAGLIIGALLAGH